MSHWFEVKNIAEIPSPSLLVFPERIEENIRRMIVLTRGNVARLRPHMKTHKMGEVIKMHLGYGIKKFKCATIAEAEMTAAAGGEDILLAYPPIGPNISRLIALIGKFPSTRFATVADSETAVRALSEAASREKITIPVYLDVDCGMHRTGIAPEAEAVRLYQFLGSLPGIKSAGLHAYDGHIHDHDPALRSQKVEQAFSAVKALRDTLEDLKLPVPNFIASGTPTFPMHAARGDCEYSPGTCVLWDWGYGKNYPDMEFLHAALVLTRIISKPAPNQLTCDLGHKAVASENPHPRVHFLNLPEARAVMHSEEHLVLDTPRAAEFEIGDVLYGVPWHICPTVALHACANVVSDGKVLTQWRVQGRDRVLSV